MKKDYTIVVSYENEESKTIKYAAARSMAIMELLQIAFTEIFDDEFYLINNIVILNKDEGADRKAHKFFKFSIR